MKKVNKLETYTIDEMKRLLGHQEENIRILEDHFHTQIIIRGDEIVIDDSEEKVKDIETVLFALLKLVKQGKDISKRDVLYTIKLASSNKLEELEQLYSIHIAKTRSGKLIYPKTLGQKEYYHALRKKEVVFGIGPAGTGKTYLAVVFAVQALKNNEVQKIVLTRPAVEAGENLGFLPGDLKEKLIPI